MICTDFEMFSAIDDLSDTHKHQDVFDAVAGA